MNDTGMPTVTQKATRPLRNRNRIATTSSSPPTPFLISRLIRSSIRVQLSSYTVSVTSGGTRWRASSSQSAMTRADSSESDAAERITRSSMTGLPW